MGLSLFFMFISAGICLLVPTAVAIVLAIKRKGNILMFMLGIASFAASQLLLRMPLLNELQNVVWFNMFASMQELLCALLVAFSAGVFEETGRYAVLKLINRDLLTWENGIMFGLGHGGVEALWITGLPLVNNIADTLTGKYTGTLAQSSPADFLMGGVERTFAILLHIGFTMLVIYAVKRRKVWCFLLAILAHGFVDIALPLARTLSGWACEGAFAAFAILSVIFTVKIKPALGHSKHTAILGTQSRLNVM